MVSGDMLCFSPDALSVQEYQRAPQPGRASGASEKGRATEVSQSNRSDPGNDCWVTCHDCRKGRMMTSRRAFVLVWLIGSTVLMPFWAALAAETATGLSVTIDEIADGIEKYIAERSKLNGGYFRLQHNKRELNLQLVRVHLEYLADLGRGVSFACVDLVETDGPVYDVDFFMKGPPGAMTVTETSVHKINGQPLYAWDQKRNGTWRKVPIKNAPRRLLGVINGTDEFEFVYRVK